MAYRMRNYYGDRWDIKPDVESIPISLYKLDAHIEYNGKKYIAFFALSKGKVYSSVQIPNGKSYTVISASFTGFSLTQGSLYVKDINMRKEGAIGTILPEGLFSIVESIIYTYNEKLGISPIEQPRGYLDDKLFTVEE